MKGRVWTYIISEALNADRLKELEGKGNDFVRSWTAHQQQLSGSFQIFKNRIVVVGVDEDTAGASGCSIDKLTRFIREMEKEFGVELMNRLLVAIKKDDGLFITHSTQITELLKENAINEDSLVYNTAASNSEELKNWEQPLKNTWLKKFLQSA